jgi:hypothetical protein
MAETGMDAPTFSTVTSAAVMVFSDAGGSFEPATGIARAALTGTDWVSPTISPHVAMTAAPLPRKESAPAGILLAFVMDGLAVVAVKTRNPGK